MADDGDKVVDKLVNMGFENVSWGENSYERVYALENIAYRLDGVGIGKALDLIQKEGLPNGKRCCLIVLDNNIPMISLSYNGNKSSDDVSRNDWDISYELGKSWEIIKKKKKENSSLYKFDITIYPEFSFRNVRLSVMYEILFNMTPTIETSLWNGSKLSAQLIIPIINQYGYRYKNIRPGIVSLSQTFRLPYNIFLTGTVGTFNGRRWGGNIKATYYMKNERIWLDGNLSYTKYGEWGKWNEDKLISSFIFIPYGGRDIFTGSIGVNYFIPKYQTQFGLKFERYLLGEYGVKLDFFRRFRYCNIGFYASRIQYAGNNGFNGGFKFLINLPPYTKYKRNGYIPRIIPAKQWGIIYNAGNEFKYGKGFKVSPSENFSTDSKYNPYYIKHELLKY
jgi:Bacterial putative lipoprotein (DUF940).